MGRVGLGAVLCVLALCSSFCAALCPAPTQERTLPGVSGSANVVEVHPIDEYFVVATDQGHVLQVHKKTLEVLASLSLGRSFTTGLLWADGDALFLGTQGFPASLHRIKLSTFEHEVAVELDHSEPEVSDLLLVPARGKQHARLVATVRSVPSHVVDFTIADGLHRETTITLMQEENFARGLSLNTYTQHVVVLTDSIPPHIVELVYDQGPGDSVVLARAGPNPDTPLPLTMTRKPAPANGTSAHPPSQGLSDVTMLCHSTSHGDRIFIGSNSRVYRINTTHTAEERARAATEGGKYITTPDMVASSPLNDGHVRARACAHDSVLKRLYVATNNGLLAYGVGTEPFGAKEPRGAKCHLSFAPSGVLGLGFDRYSGLVFATSTTPDYGVVVHAVQVVPSPSLAADAVAPPAAPLHSGRLLDITGANFTDLFPSPIRVGFARVRGTTEPGHLPSLEPPVMFDATFHSPAHLSLVVPDVLVVGEYVVTVHEHAGAIATPEAVAPGQAAMFFAYQNPSLLEVSPGVARSRGGSLLSISGRNFVDTGALHTEFVCNGEHHAANATFVTSTHLTVRSPDVQGHECTAMVRVSQNGLDWVPEYAGQVQLVNVEVTAVEPVVMSVRGDADFSVRGSGYVDCDDVVIAFKKKGISQRPGATVDGFNVTGYFDDSFETLFSKTLAFPSPGLFSVDVFFGGIKVTDSKATVEVVNVTTSGLSPVLVGATGGVDLKVTGTGFPKHHPVALSIVPAALGTGQGEVEVGAEVNDQGTAATIRMPALLPGKYHLFFRLSSSEDIPLPPTKQLTVHAAPSFAIDASSSCAHKGERAHVLLAFPDEAARALLASSPALASRLAVKFVADSSPAMAGAGAVQMRSFFQGVESVVSASAVALVEGADDAGPHLNVSVKFGAAGKTYRAFVSLNGEEYYQASGSVFAFEFAPQALSPVAGPTAGNTAVTITGAGHIKQCGGVTPRVRLHGYVAGREGDNWHVEANARVVDSTTVAFQSPPVDRAGVVRVEVGLDGVQWIPVPVELPNDNFLYYHTEYSAITPHLGASTGGTVVTLHGSGFPDTGEVDVRLGKDGSEGSRVVKAEWKSATELVFTAPAMAVGVHAVAVSFNAQNWKSLLGLEFVVYQAVEESDLGLSPVAGPISGGTAIQLTLRDGDELLHNQLAVGFTCNGERVAVVAPDDGSTPQRSEVEVPGGTKKLATFALHTPSLKQACVAEVAIARNGHDFSGTGHHFKFYHVDAQQLTVSPAVLVHDQEMLIQGSGFVDAGDEMFVKFTNTNTPFPTAHITAELSFSDESELSFTVPDLSSLWDGHESAVATVAVTFNNQQWIDVVSGVRYED